MPTPLQPTRLPALCLTLYLLAVLTFVLTIDHRNAGTFTYALDDPYIHLALAEQLAHGHYGINPGEASSPSSSILWPFLLTPGAGTPWHPCLPLALNTLFGSLAAWLIGTLAAACPRPLRTWQRTTLAILLLLVANLAGLTLLGMEHTLQVLLAIACAYGLIAAWHQRSIPTWTLAAAIIGPMVRYENFAIVAAIAIVLYALNRRRAALTVAALSLIGPVAFSAFLISRGLPALPSSVLVKTHAYSDRTSAATRALDSIMRTFRWGFAAPEWWAQIAVTALLFWLASRERIPIRATLLRAAALAGLLQIFVGQYGWSHRYEVYALIFTTLIAATALLDTTRLPFGLPPTAALALGLLALARPYLLALYETPTGAANVFQQQYQTHRFLAAYPQTVAVNDLGYISYQRTPLPSGQTPYILDLWGLANPEASRQPDKDADWLDAITARHHAGLAIVYPAWFEQIPDDWTELATLCMSSRPILSRPCTTFYSTATGNPSALRRQLTAFARTLPPTVALNITPH